LFKALSAVSLAKHSTYVDFHAVSGKLFGNTFFVIKETFLDEIFLFPLCMKG